MSSDIKEPVTKKLCICCHGEFSAELTTCPNDGTALSKLEPNSLVGTVFCEKYEILNVIGGGGMGLVYRAKHRFMNRIVAIKVLHKSQINSSDALKRFQIEAQAASVLSMPHIVTIYDFGTSDIGEPFMVMDFLDGRSLTEIIESEGKFSLPRALNIFVQLSQALSHAHSKGVIHRDIKPSNIVLVKTEREPDFVKIVDFGIAKLVNADPDSGNLTRTGEIFGSPLYMSPEQCRGQKLDARTDIYSLGSVMYRAISGKNIYDNTDVLQLMYKQISEMPPSFQAIGIDVPAEVEAVIFKALAKDPDARYQSMDDLAEGLEQLRKSILTDSPGSSQATAIAGETVTAGSDPASQAAPLNAVRSTSKATSKNDLKTALMQFRALPEETFSSSSATARMSAEQTAKTAVNAQTDSQNSTIPAEEQPIPTNTSTTPTNTSTIPTDTPTIPTNTSTTPTNTQTSQDKEQTIQINIPKRAIGVGIGAVLVSAAVVSFFVFAPHSEKTPGVPPVTTAPVRAAPALSTPPPKIDGKNEEQTLQPDVPTMDKTDSKEKALAKGAKPRVRKPQASHSRIEAATPSKTVEHTTSTPPHVLGGLKNTLKKWWHKL